MRTALGGSLNKTFNKIFCYHKYTCGDILKHKNKKGGKDENSRATKQSGQAWV